MNLSYDQCHTHGKPYQLIGNDSHCRLNCRICYDCLRTADSLHKKGVSNHQTISIEQLGMHFQKLEKHSQNAITQCDEALQRYFRTFQTLLLDQLRKQKGKLSKFIRRILLVGVTKDQKRLETILALFNRNFESVRCDQVAEVSDILFNFVPKNNNPGFAKFIQHINGKQSNIFDAVKEIISNKAWNSTCLSTIQSDLSFPDFQEPIKASRVKTEEDSPKKTLRRSLVKKDQRKMDLKDLSVNLRKPLELGGSKLIDSREQNVFMGRMFQSRQVSHAHLLFRASQHDFSVKKFHHLCDGESNTLVLVKTEFGKVIGGFTSIPWKSTANTLHSDVRRESFLFSLSLKQKMSLIDQKSATFNSVNFGPTFGAGADIAICHNAHLQKTSYSEFPYSYGNSRYKESSQHSTTLFTGQKVGNHFLIREWEVWKINFE